MKPRVGKCALLLLCLLAFSNSQPTCFIGVGLASNNVDADSAPRAFIANVLPIDFSKYTITLKNHVYDGETDLFIYTLDSDVSTLRVICLYRNSILLSCTLSADKGQLISDRTYVNLVDAAKSILERYQSYTKIYSANLIEMLSSIDATRDVNILSGNINFTKCTTKAYDIEVTTFSWAYTVNGAKYTELIIEFQNGIFHTLYDTRNIYTIGDTTVNITAEQAVNIAVNYSEAYSYSLTDGRRISGFNITKDRSTARLVAYPVNSTVLRPYWHVELFLNQTYPGSVVGLTIFVWANSGEVFLCNPIAYGGSADNNLASPSSSTESITGVLGVTIITVTAIIATVYTLFIKKKKNVLHLKS